MKAISNLPSINADQLRRELPSEGVRLIEAHTVTDPDAPEGFRAVSAHVIIESDDIKEDAIRAILDRHVPEPSEAERRKLADEARIAQHPLLKALLARIEKLETEVASLKRSA